MQHGATSLGGLLSDARKLLRVLTPMPHSLANLIKLCAGEVNI